MGNSLKISFGTLPLEGFELADQGFTYAVKEARPHTNRDGTESMVVTWIGCCAEDGELFEFKSGRSVYTLPRRCPVHAKGKGWDRVKPYDPDRPQTPAEKFEAMGAAWLKKAELDALMSDGTITPAEAWDQIKALFYKALK